MEERKLTTAALDAFGLWLRTQERAAGTMEAYSRATAAFAAWAEGRAVSRELAAAWRDHLLTTGRAPATVNAMLAAVNALFRCLGWEDCRAKPLRLQRQMFREPSRDLSRGEYDRLVSAAQSLGRTRLALVLETICATGIRVSELRYITAESVRLGRAEIALKGKIRTILLPGKLCRKLEKYARAQKIASGEVFLTGSGRPLSRRQIWAEMKALCVHAGVAPSKVFPHNLRHLFAVSFYRACKDVVKLADVLGHSSVETTRVYLLSTGEEHVRTLDRLGLVS